MFDTFKPTPPHSFLLGNLVTLGKLVSSLPSNLHPHSFFHFLQLKYPNLGPILYVDNWPFAYPICAVLDAEIANQCTQQHSLPKHEINKFYVEPIAGKHNLLTMEEEEWKRWRAVFNPGFASGHLMSLVPAIIDDILIFCSTLSKRAADGGVFQLVEDTTKLTIDVIGRVVLYKFEISILAELMLISIEIHR